MRKVNNYCFTFHLWFLMEVMGRRKAPSSFRLLSHRHTYVGYDTQLGYQHTTSAQLLKTCRRSLHLFAGYKDIAVEMALHGTSTG